MRTTYYHYIDGSVGIGTTYHTLATGTVNEFGIGISSHIGIGTVNNKFAQFAIHHDGPASESKRTGGLEINANSNASGDKHGARILAYNRVFSDKGFRRLRFSASEFQFETPSDNGTSTNNADPAVGITSLGNVGIGTTNTIDTYDGGFERRLVVYGGGAQVGSAYTWTGGDFYHAEDIITAVTKSKSGGFAINCRDQEVSATDPSKPVWTLRSYSNEPIAFGQGLTEIARFDENGNLGIGISTPSAKLEIRDSASQGIIVRSTNTQATDVNKAIRVRNNSDTDTFSVSHRGHCQTNSIKFTPMTTTERNALNLGSSDTGTVIYNSSINKLQLWIGASWISLDGGGEGP